MNPGILILFLFFCLLVARSISVYRINTTNVDGSFRVNEKLNTHSIILIASATSCILYVLFFCCATWIWSLHENYPESIFTAEIGAASPSAQQDGIESSVLYCMMIANIILSLLLAAFFQKNISQQAGYKICYSLLLLFTGCYLYCVDFVPPMSDDAHHLATSLVIVFCSICLFFLRKKNKFTAISIVIILISFAGLMATSKISTHDLTYILCPALKLKYGDNISDIYFQYDIFLSLIALLYMKLKIALAWFAYLGQFSFFLLFISLFFFTDRFLKSKGLSVLFIIALVLVRYYSKPPDWDMIVPVSPLRLDLWVILLLVANKKGAYHWATGICVGLLIIFHRNLGVIYCIAYLQLIAVLFFYDIVYVIRTDGFFRNNFLPVFIKHFRLSIVNLILISCSIAFCFLVFHTLFSESALMYRKLGVGMLQISRHSFYWYVPVVLSSIFLLVAFNKQKLGVAYSNTVLFVILLTIGNSMYFFGRSHENNILNLSAILVLSLFLFFDVCIYLFSDHFLTFSFFGRSGQRRYTTGINYYVLLPFLFIFLVGFYYSGNVSANFKIQLDKVRNKQVAVSLPGGVSEGVYQVKDIVRNSQKVYFLDFNNDFFYYYYGNYCPVGYYSPCSSWIYKADMINYLQKLLNDDYYIIYRTKDIPALQDYLHALKYDEVHQQDNIVAIKKK